MRVFLPLVCTPHGLWLMRPFCLPLPPPCGWSTGFMATPRTCAQHSLSLHPEEAHAGKESISFSWIQLSCLTVHQDASSLCSTCTQSAIEKRCIFWQGMFRVCHPPQAACPTTWRRRPCQACGSCAGDWTARPRWRCSWPAHASVCLKAAAPLHTRQSLHPMQRWSVAVLSIWDHDDPHLPFAWL